MKRKPYFIMTLSVLALMAAAGSCKKADTTTGTLTVILSAGVTGVPEAGTYSEVVGDKVSYSYVLSEGYSKLTVVLDGTQVDASGTITISGDHVLQAYADDNRQYTLTVTLGAGATGSPEAGTHAYAKDTVVPYSYALDDGYKDLSVKLDSATVNSSGTVTMSADHVLSISATAKDNIQGAWSLSETYEDGSSFDVTATFTGDYTKGTVADSDGGQGTYTVNDTAVTFTLVFPDVTYTYTGSFSDADTMSGSCTRYQTEDNVISGTWSATRSTASAASRATGRIRKGAASRTK
jgi:hypothetical protein